MGWNDETLFSGGSRYTTNTDFICLISTLLNVVLKLEIALGKNIVFLTAQQCSGGITHFFSVTQQERFKWQAQPQAPQGWNKKHFQMVGINSMKPRLGLSSTPEGILKRKGKACWSHWEDSGRFRVVWIKHVASMIISLMSNPTYSHETI